MNKPEQILLVCINHNLKKTARATAAAFDSALRPFGLRSGQFALLAALRQSGTMTLRDLGNMLGLDRTTLLRNLRPLEAEGLIGRSKDGNRILVQLSPSGRRKFRRAFPAWRKMQTSIVHSYGKDRWEHLRKGCDELRKSTAHAHQGSRDSK